jgi:hypothetical protein
MAFIAQSNAWEFEGVAKSVESEDSRSQMEKEESS